MLLFWYFLADIDGDLGVTFGAISSLSLSLIFFII